MALLIGEEDVGRLVTADDAFLAVTEAHLALSMGLATNVERTRARTPQMSLHSMSAASVAIDFAATKVYSATATHVQSSLLLFRVSSGELLAIIEANELGRLRTAAASIVAASLLCEIESATLGIIGCGFQAEGIARAFLAKSCSININKILVYCRTAEDCQTFADRLTRQYNCDALPASSARSLVESSNIVVTATNSSQPVIENQWLTTCTHISAIGSNALSRRELSPQVITAASLIVVDSKDSARQESGNLLSPIENGKIQWAEIAELGEVLRRGTKHITQDRPKKANSKAIEKARALTIFCSHGLAVQDLYLAQLVYERFIG